MAVISDLIVQEAQKQGLDPRLALEVAIQESGLKQTAKSPRGAIGVFQLMPATALELGIRPQILEENIRGGVTYLKQLLGRFQDVRTALAAYNWGPGAVARAIADRGAKWLEYAPTETKNYVTDILNRLETKYKVTVEPVAAAKAIGKALTSPEGEKIKTVILIVLVTGAIAAFVKSLTGGSQ